MPTEITFIFRKFEGYIHSGIGSKSVPVGRLADENAILFEFLKFSFEQMLQLLACLNEDIRSILRAVVIIIALR